MAAHEHPTAGPPGHVAEIGREPGPVATDLLQVRVVAARSQPGATVVEVAISGELCALTAGVLRSCLDELTSDGTTRLVADVSQLRLCTSDGVAALIDADAALRRREGGRLELVGATAGVGRVFGVLRAGDPSFGLDVHHAAV